MHTGLDSGVLRRQTVSVKADREQDVVALEPALSAHDLQAGVRLDVADMHAVAGRIRELDQRIELRLAAAVLCTEAVVRIPVILPLLLNCQKIVFLHTRKPLFRE